MTMVRFATWGLALMAGLSMLGGCSGGQKAEEPKTAETGKTEEPTKVDGTLKVALLTPGPVSDSGWSALAYDGLKAIETDLGAEIANQEAKGTQIKDAMRTYANQGFQLVIGHGFEYNGPGV